MKAFSKQINCKLIAQVSAAHLYIKAVRQILQLMAITRIYGKSKLELFSNKLCLVTLKFQK